jgi:hypothetical protein
MTTTAKRLDVCPVHSALYAYCAPEHAANTLTLTDAPSQPEASPPQPAPRPKRVRPKSRSARWNDATAAARRALDDLIAARDQLVTAIGEIKDVRDEYEAWKDNLPENLTQSALGEKLDTLCNIDLEPDEDDVAALTTAVEESEGADLPLGFGRD